ncbi:hypothetical protein BsWGS_22646 [Bradybaena similaris]
MTKFQINPELLIGSSSQIDAVFLPVHIDHGHGTNQDLDYHRINGYTWPNQGHQNDFQQQQSLLETSELEESQPETERNADLASAGASEALMHALTTDSPDSNDRCYRASLTSILVIIIIILLLVFGHSYIHWVLMWLEQSGPAVGVSVLMMLFLLICFPVAWGLQLLMLAAGYLYGLLYGALVVTMCLSVGLLVSIPAMRYLCSNYLRSHFYSRKVEAIVSVVSGPHGMKIIALTRLTPIPFGLQNTLFSLSSISILRLLVSSVGGLVPMTVLNCYMGSTLRNMEDLISADSNRLTGFLILGGQIFMTVILLCFVVRKARLELKKTMDESDRLPTALSNGDCIGGVLVEEP